jgi:hypothetical protein
MIFFFAYLHVSCGFICENMFPREFSVVFAAELPADLFSFFGRKFRRKQLLTKILAGNPNLDEILQETRFL